MTRCFMHLAGLGRRRTSRKPLCGVAESLPRGGEVVDPGAATCADADAALRGTRIALLARIKMRFDAIADISFL